MRATDRDCLQVRRGAAALLGVLLSAAVGLAQGPGPEAGPQPAASAKVLVADVIPQGNHTVSTQRIMSLIKTRPGAEYAKATVDDDLRRLYETKLFRNVEARTAPADDGKVLVYFLIVEYPSTIQDIVYQGAKHFKPDELDTVTGLRRGAPMNPIANKLACQAIQRHYNEAGRMFASVELLEGDRPGDGRIVFNITEGPVVRVSGIGFTGNNFVSSARLNTQVNSSHQVFGLFGGTFNPMMADMDVSKLEEYYKTFGFHDVRVARELQWDEDHRHVRLVFHINEGQRYRVKDVQVDGASTLAPDMLLTGCKLERGEFYDKRKVDVDLATIKDKYGWQGYGVQAREQNYVTGPGLMTVHYEVQERPPATVGQIIIVGNEVTRQNVILRQIPLLPGQTLTYPDLRVAERNLARLNIFEVNPENGIRPTVGVLDADSDCPVKDILVNVKETQTGSLLFGIGVNSDAGLVGSVVLNERNFDILRPPTSFEDLLSGRAFRGGGQEFRAEAVPGTQLQRYTVSWREPFLFDSPYSLGVSGYYYDRIFTEYRESRLGTRITLGRKLNQYWSVSGTMRVESVGVHDVPFYAPEEIQSVEGQNFLIAFQAGLTYDSRDSYLRPTEGSKLDISFEEVTGDFTYPIFAVEGNKYFTAYQRPDGSGRHVLAARSVFSIAGTHTPVYDRFYAGGFRSMRGFEFRGVGPDVLGFKVGGDFMWLNSLEYQIPLLANDQLYFVTFVDSGTVERNVEIKDYRVTAGFGLRIVVPMLGPVPIALDFGFPIVKAPEDREQTFSFWIGFFH
jgi:outer membrane protein assembly factor BamA